MADIVMEGFSSNDVTLDVLIAQQQTLAKEHGRELTEEEAFEEVIANALEGVMADGKVAQFLQQLEGRDKSLGARVRRFFNDIDQLIRDTLDAYAGVMPDSVEGIMISQLEDTYKQLQKALAEGIYQAGETFRQAEKTTAQTDGGVEMQKRLVGGKQIVWIENSGFTNSKLQDPNVIAKYIAGHIGDVYRIIESGQSVYIGKDLPGEYTHSDYTSYLKKKKPATLKAKNKAASSLGEMIEIATNRRWEKTKHSHNKDAKYGMYRYDTQFAFPIKDQSGNVISVKAYDAELLIRNASDGKKYLYDILNIKEDTASALDLRHKEARKGSYKAATQSNVSTDSIRNSNGNVNNNSGRQNQKRSSTLTNRDVLAGSPDSAAQNDMELKYLRQYREQLDKVQEQDAAHRFGSFTAFRQAVMGSITVAKEGDTSLDSFWQEMSALYPDVFDGEMTAGDMPGALADVIDRLRNEDTSLLEYTYNRDMIRQDLIRQVYDTYWNVSYHISRIEN